MAGGLVSTFLIRQAVSYGVQRLVYSSLSGVVTGVTTGVLSVLAKFLASFEMAVSQSAFERSLMQKDFMMMVGTSLSTLLVLNWDGLGRLGFYVEAAPQIFSLLISYAAVKNLPHTEHL